MARSTDMSRAARIKREVDRLRKNLTDVPQHKRRLTSGLVHRAAFLRVELEDLEKDINEHGSTEEYYSHPEAPPITRIRAAAQQYDKLVKSYNATCKQLADLIPAKPPAGGGDGKEEKDPFEELVNKKASGRMKRVK